MHRQARQREQQVRRFAECDKNLCAPQLSPSDRARFTKRRKEAYEALHPQTVHGGNADPSGQFGHTEVPAFVEATAKATGASERVVRRDAERGQKILPEVLDMIAGTSITGERITATIPVGGAVRERHPLQPPRHAWN